MARAPFGLMIDSGRPNDEAIACAILSLLETNLARARAEVSAARQMIATAREPLD